MDREQFEELLRWVRAQSPDPVAGIYGPDSISWRLNREVIVFLGGGRAALLQTAHPFVAHAIEQHSKTRTDPLGRFQRTFDHVFAMIYGTLDHAERSARRVRAIHERIVGSLREDIGVHARGDRYEANEEQALLWVYATLVETAALVHERFVRRLTDDEKERYYRESWRFAALFGISREALPPTWTAFMDYNRRMWDSDTLGVGAPAMELRRFLFHSPRRSRRPVFRWLELVTAGLMPSRLRDAYALPYGPQARLLCKASFALVRAVYPRVPARLRTHPAYIEACRRVRGAPRRDRVGRALERAALSLLDKGTADDAA